MKRRFVESVQFSLDRRALEKSGNLVMDDLISLELAIMKTPHVGDLIQGTGGLRKVRLPLREVARGKRGGARVVYLDLPHVGVTHLLAIFSKRERIDLAPMERRALREHVRRLKDEAEATRQRRR